MKNLMRDGWLTSPLGDLARIYSGGTPSRSVPAFWGGEIPWVTTTEIDGGVINSARERITEEGLKASAARVAQPGTLLLAMYGQGKTRGKAAMLGIAAAMNQACAAIEVGSRIDPRYLLHYLNATYEEIRSMSNAGSQENLSGEIVRKIPVWFPPLPEQRTVVRALDDVSSSEDALERIVAKKRAIKQGMMQQLLTGQTRLPGFDDPWVDVKVGDVLEFKNGLNKGSDFFGAGTPIVNFMDVMNGPIIRSIDVTGRVTLTKDEIKRFSARQGDVFFTRTSETVEEVGTAAVLVDDIPYACFSGFILRGRPTSCGVDSRFLARVFQLDIVRAQVASSATYTTRALTNGRSLGEVAISLPSVDEQRAIALVLADVDAEIAELRARLAKTRAIKNGMMQQLLTGRISLLAGVAS